MQFGVFKNLLQTAVAMATLTFQYRGYFSFKVIEFENKVGDPSFIDFSILNHWYDFCHTNFSSSEM